MTRKSHRVVSNLDAKGIQVIAQEELNAILRGADEIIGKGGRSLLKAILRGSRARPVREHGLNHSPVHGFFHELPDDEVLARIDWTILNGYLRIHQESRLPLLVFTQKGWEIERENYANELLAGFDDVIRRGPPFETEYLKDRDREMIFLLLDKIAASKDKKYVAVLDAWRKLDYQKVRRRISQVIDQLEKRHA